MTTGSPLRVANCSGFFGDRLSAAREMVDGGSIDVLTGDWLAELTMGLLARQRRRDADAGFAGTFVTQLEDVLGDCLDRGIKIVSNAGGLNPHGCAEQVRAIAERSGRTVNVAVVYGDDVADTFAEARTNGWSAPHLDTGEELGAEVEPEVVSAYLGAWGIVEALDAGADVVVTGRVTDAAIIVGPAAWHHRWKRNDWDALAGAVAAGHVIECGAHATGGNFSFFREVPDMRLAGFPLAEIFPDGSSVITKHARTAGAVTIDTVTAQLLYEIDGPRYLNPDVITRLDTIQLSDDGPDRVRLSGARGEPAPRTVKVGALVAGGWRNETTFVLTGLNVEEKAELAEELLWLQMYCGREDFDSVTTRLLRADRPNPATMNDAVSLFTITVTGKDRRLVGSLSRAAVETGLATYPGAYFTTPPGAGSEFTVFWPTLLPVEAVQQHVELGGTTWTIPSPPTDDNAESIAPHFDYPSIPSGPFSEAALGTVLGARSGDKGGNATLGVWARTEDAHAWLRSWWNATEIHQLIPEAADCELRLWELPQLRACGVTIVGLLGRGVAANPNLDSQAKGLGEYLRAKHVPVPTALIRTGHS
ncbi:acyclic terpene utilization AtuA family protein [Williamsia soli]|uniref:acyclic terpene utilization AtuA family protein n=1 Tax=Williamsia soli TaxID=364929 RepID=UPI001A9EF953|nr:acyclic terpene utilization AtuA family protein [Williamsia soli]